MVTSMLEKAIEIEGLLRIIRDGNPLPETYTLLNAKTAELTELAQSLEERESASGTMEVAMVVSTDETLTAPDEKSTSQESFDIETTDQPSGAASEEEPTERAESAETPAESEILAEGVNSSAEGDFVLAAAIEAPEHPAVIFGEDDPALFHKSSTDNLSQPESTEQLETNPAVSGVEDELELTEDDDIPLDLEDTPEISTDGLETPAEEQKPIDLTPTEQERPKRQVKLKSAFSLNDRFLYSRELFGGNMKMFDSSLEFIEGIEDYSIIEDYFYNELEWNPEDGNVAAFMEILRPHFGC